MNTINDKNVRLAAYRWSKMTDANDHHNVRIAIARYFGMKEYEEYFKAFRAFWLQGSTAEALKHQTHAEWEERKRRYNEFCDKTDSMLDDIRRIYGENIYKSVHLSL